MIKTNNNYPNFNWIQVIDPTDEELIEISDKYKLNLEMIEYATDKFESPRFEHDGDTDLIIMDGIAEHSDKKAVIQPISFFVQKNDRLITFTNHGTSQMLDETMQKSPKSFLSSITNEKTKPLDLVLNAFFNLTANYLDALSEVERQHNLLQKEIYVHRNSEYLSELLNVKVNLIYYLNALERNKATLDQFRNDNQQKIDISEDEFLEDIEIEMKQALDMANISTKIMNLLSDAYENIVTNNTNRSMSILTVASIVLAIPAIVVGFFGMNVHLPMTDGTFSWILITFGTTIIMVWVYQILKRHGFFN
ncbi:magnesium transporter CorA family protein [Xylocopilactobacillus apis]|uniref:Magnesium transporter CorA family protein n=1 Tax=Xylocopilactobacillus apis TaxID=2932183 RepID=A0AAU9DN83_9LACO|nr:magnesium transporter CorA family protein [Xylocopilactobacillus apis]BDR57169.1 hypothetical protein KIMC2_17310 [Xylocopilactobacillus apis]